MTAAGDAGNNFLMSVFTEEEKVEEFAGGAQKLLADAKNGSWAISEEGGKQFISALDEALSQLAEVNRDIRFLCRAPTLGNDKYAQQVAQHVLTALDSDDTSMAKSYEEFRRVLENTREALIIATQNFKKTDEEATQKLDPFLKDLES